MVNLEGCCLGIVPRSRLEDAIGVRQRLRRMSDSFPTTPKSTPESSQVNGPNRGPLLLVKRLMDQTPHTCFEDMPVS